MTYLRRLGIVIGLICCFMTAGVSVYAENAAVDGDESNPQLDKVVIDRSFSEITINELKCDWADGTTVLPPSPWRIKTDYGFSEENANAVKASYKNIGGNAPYLRGLWSHDNALGGGAYGNKQIYLTDKKYLSGNFAVELKYIPYNTAQFPNGNYYGAMPFYETGVIQIAVGDHKYDGQAETFGKSAYWDFSFPSNSAFPAGIKSNVAGSKSYSYNYAEGAELKPTIGAPVEELPDDFDGYHYARIEFTVDNGVTVLTKRGENTPWKKANIQGTDAAEAMRSLRVPESNDKLIFDLHRGIVGVDSVKVYKSSDEYPDCIVDSFEMERTGELEYNAKVEMTNIGVPMSAKLYMQIYEVTGSATTLVSENSSDIVLDTGASDISTQSVTLPRNDKTYIVKAYIANGSASLATKEMGYIPLSDTTMTPTGSVTFNNTIDFASDAQFIFINKDTNEQTSAAYTSEGSTTAISPASELEEGVEYEVTVIPSQTVFGREVTFYGSQPIKVLYNIKAALSKASGGIKYTLENTLNKEMSADLFIVKYTGKRMTSIEHETVSLSANETKTATVPVELQKGQTAKAFIFNNSTDYVLVCDSIKLE